MYSNRSSFQLIFTNDSTDAIMEENKIQQDIIEYFMNHSLFDSLFYMIPTVGRITNALMHKAVHVLMSDQFDVIISSSLVLGAHALCQKTLINVHSGDWIVRESGIDTGIDSYYEYLFKANVLLGEKNNDYLSGFQEHCSSIMSYVQQGVAIVNVHMHQSYRWTKNHMDALLAFWPRLQVMTGDLKSAIELHEMLYQVVKNHKFLPETFTTDHRIHRNSHPLRPEFVESTYYSYDSHYLEVGRTILTNLEKYARVPCGCAAISDVSTGQYEDRIDSFLLTETFKYLYSLVDSTPHRYVDIEQFIFIKEACLLPLNLLLFNINDALRKEFDKTTLLSACVYKQKSLSLTET
ncbi:unnamed protein product [Rotaria sordida]|nr:unnamed protein product [Rotaria sordida]CAF3820969.1 unnamed protein product [Rotaria sordida]CAF4105697.1 unnamed protein product [Rotaria sordida]